MAQRHNEDEGEGEGIVKKSRREEIELSWMGKTWCFPMGTRVEDALSCIAFFSEQNERLAIVAEEEDGRFHIYEKHAVLAEGRNYSVSTFGVRKPLSNLPRRFGAGHAVDPQGFYFVEPDVDAFLQDIKSGKYCVICGRRQSGKTTIAKVVIERLTREGDIVPVYISGLEVSAKYFTASQMWAYFWDRLHMACPSLFEKRPETAGYCLSINFQALFAKATLQFPVALIMDEADSLLMLSNECLDDFFHAIRDVKQNRSSHNLMSFVLIGVETVKDLLEAQYDQRRRAQAGGAYVPSSTPSRLSPFPHDHTIDPSGFEVADIKNLLQQADNDLCGELNDIQEIAASIMDQTAGHKGLVGTCLAYLMQERAYDYKAWMELSDSYKLGTFVFGQATYNRILQSFKWQVGASQEQFDLLVGFLQNGGQEYAKSDLFMIRTLLAEGVLAVKEESGGTCLVDLSSPLLRTAILRKCVITDQEVERPPTITSVDRKWVIIQAVKSLDGDLMSQPECVNSDGSSSSEYIHQFLFMSRVKTILRQAYPHIRCFVLPEVKEKQVPGKRRRQLRLDTLVRDGPNCARMGFELVVNASLKSAEEHERRAQKYCEQHSAQVFMINFTKDKRAILVKPNSDGVYSMAVQFNSADNTASVRCLDVHGSLEENMVQLTKWTGVLSFQDLV